MEPILSKLQEGVKYPRFERDATKTINDLVEHITKERGVYSSSIEPNPNEHSIWFNTNDNTLYIYDGSVWETINDKNIHISKELEFHSYPIINIYDNSESMNDWSIEENKHYVIIIDTSNIRNYLNNIVINNDDREFIIIGDNTNINGTFLINIYDTYIYYIRLSQSYIKEDNVFYCDGGILFYDGDNENYGSNGLNISGYYTKERLKYIIEDNERKPLEKIYLSAAFIEPDDNTTVIFGNNDFYSDFSILGTDLDDAKIYMYSNILHIGNSCDDIVTFDSINWYSATVFCNCKEIGEITITNNFSTLNLYISSIDFIVGNNNILKIDSGVCGSIDECNIYAIKETNNDKSQVIIEDVINGNIDSYINLCGTELKGTPENGIRCNTFITTTINDIDKPNMESTCINFNLCDTLIIDAPYRTFTNTAFINYLKTCTDLKVYVTNMQLINFLQNQGMRPIGVTSHITYHDDRVEVLYKNAANSAIIVYKRIIPKC